MLTPQEYEQIKTALECAAGYNINECMFIPRQNVLCILQNYVEQPAITEDSDPNELLEE